MKKFSLALAALAIAAVPVMASADEADVTIDGTAAGAGIYYVDVETSGLYEETNGLAGLQTTETVVDDVVIAPDTQLP